MSKLQLHSASVNNDRAQDPIYFFGQVQMQTEDAENAAYGDVPAPSSVATVDEITTTGTQERYQKAPVQQKTVHTYGISDLR